MGRFETVWDGLGRFGTDAFWDVLGQFGTDWDGLFATTMLVLFITKIAKNALFRIPSLKFRLELPKISGTVSTSVSLFCSGVRYCTTQY